MSLFHDTLNDASEAVKKGDSAGIEHAKGILQHHRDMEVQEEKLVDSSLFSLKRYLENYIRHLDFAITIVSSGSLDEGSKAEFDKNISICQENITCFENGVEELWKKRGKELR